MPSLADLETNLGNYGFEVVIVNRTIEPVLEELVQIAHCIALDCPASNVSVLVQKLAEFVTGHMGGPVKDANIMLARWMDRSMELRTSLHTSLLPIGSINIGLSQHHALLFKVLADNIKLPCRLVEGSHYTGVEDDAVNMLKLEDERDFLVDLMAAPGTLIPADVFSAKDTALKMTKNLFADLNPFQIKGTDKTYLQNKSTESKVDDLQRQKMTIVISRPPVSLRKNRPTYNEIPKKKEYNYVDGLFPKINRESYEFHQSASASTSSTKSEKVHPHGFKLLGDSNLPNNDNKSRDRLSDMGQSLTSTTGQFNNAPMVQDVSTNFNGEKSNGWQDVQNNTVDMVKDQESNEVGLHDHREAKPDKCMGKNLKLKNPESPRSPVDCITERVDQLFDDVDVGDFEIAWEDLLIGERIGLGSYGEVYHADWNDTEVAVKKFLDQDFSGAALAGFKRENARHPEKETPGVPSFGEGCNTISISQNEKPKYPWKGFQTQVDDFKTIFSHAISCVSVGIHLLPEGEQRIGPKFSKINATILEEHAKTSHLVTTDPREIVDDVSLFSENVRLCILFKDFVHEIVALIRVQAYLGKAL
ncbi:hypothetical protein SLEP1_g36625 [Rubroshorea leprosula]|uniref:EDR1/CTR1/ARMC3-like peptidase-like domain-containing protein n=1 Tax=Rubroshorea leprosula TaxID=152421 RepID=A0AAV5KSA9_9ROSI|nr:hypothetical protein SLEP1_g36625 [Rubroshorea leprosula]